MVLWRSAVFDLVDIPAATPPPGVAEKAPSLPRRVPGDPERLLPTSSPRFPGGALPEARGGGGGLPLKQLVHCNFNYIELKTRIFNRASAS